MTKPVPNDAIAVQETIFNAALQLQDPEKRAIYLDLACNGAPELRARIEKLLGADERNTVLIQPLSRPATHCPAASAPSQTSSDESTAQVPGDRIGRYKLLQKIGEGGCGVVYMAEQEEPVRRRVALKIIKLGMDTAQVIARFEAERQALAMMDHPNIARILDGGVTESGRPYFVMDLVQGLPIIQFCDEAELSTTARLNLFVEVCSAVQHAHQKGIIHRDLKPSNILVTLHGDKPVPKIIDFGIAKATQQRLTDKTLFTQFQQFIGTPAYMSPEQATLSGLDIDTRSDIYSLGVLLYELLTGKTPFDAKELLQAGLDEMRRTIREVEPVKPSTRLTQELARRSTGLAKAEIQNQKSKIENDLDWIVMKCLEKDRARRYETANGLASDIQRHLRNEPVVACPPSAAYRFRKTVRRNKGAFAAAVSILALLILGAGGSTWEAVRAHRAEEEQARSRRKAEDNEKRATASEKKALTEAEKSDQIARFFGKMLEGIGPSVAQGRDTAVLREILDRAAASIGTDLTNNPEAEQWLLHSFGKVYVQLGQLTEAEEMQRRALAIAQRMYGEEDWETGYMALYLSDILWRGPRPEEAEAAARHALQIFEKLPDGDKKDRAVGLTLEKLGHGLRYQGDFEASASAFRDSLQIMRKVWGSNSVQAATELNNLANDIRDLGRPAEAEAMLRECLEINRRNHVPENTPGSALTFHNLAVACVRQGKLEQAESAWRRRLTILRELVGDRPDLYPNLAMGVVGVFDNLVDVSKREHKAEESNELQHERHQYLRKISDALAAQDQSQNADLLWARGQVYARLGNWNHAADDLSRASQLHPEDHRIWPCLMAVLVRQGDTASYQARRNEAIKLFAEKKHASTAEQIARCSLVFPPSQIELKAILKMLEVSRGQGKNNGRLAWLECGGALADCRQGHFTEAIDLTQKILSANNDRDLALSVDALRNSDSPACDVQACAVSALAWNKLNQLDAARDSLARGVYLAEKKLPTVESGDLGGEWVEWIIAHALLHEASELIKGVQNSSLTRTNNEPK